jgi:hypothetical protein
MTVESTFSLTSNLVPYIPKKVQIYFSVDEGMYQLHDIKIICVLLQF